MAIITFISDSGTKAVSVPNGTLVIDALNRCGVTVPAACGRRGTCGKCAVKLSSGRVCGDEPDENGFVRSCRAAVCGDAAFVVPFKSGNGLTEVSAFTPAGAGGIAVDIGTTTVAASMINENGGLVSVSRLNPQSAFGADVISRIAQCGSGKLEEMTRAIRETVASMADELTGGRGAEEMAVAGNTVMLHIFCGVSPESMGVSPFTPQFTGAVEVSGEEYGINAKKITVLPSVSAFIGADTVAGIYALDLHKTEKKLLLADLGTNGELVISNKGTLFCASAAAGPALEGACIECGTGGVSGAVSRVFRDGDEIGFETVGGAEPCGICGAGIVDAVALMLQSGAVDETGYLETERFYITGGVYLTPADIRQFQLAKSAVRAGTETLAAAAGVGINELDRVYIAGGLGFYMDPESAFCTGLLPRVGAEKVEGAGNTSLLGALMCLGNGGAIAELETIAEKCRTVDLGGNPEFSQRFTDYMFFD